ncbi:uncharacterized protein LOC144292783 isoform X1 [Canis aureus]
MRCSGQHRDIRLTEGLLGVEESLGRRLAGDSETAPQPRAWDLASRSLSLGPNGATQKCAGRNLRLQPTSINGREEVRGEPTETRSHPSCQRLPEAVAPDTGPGGLHRAERFPC